MTDDVVAELDAWLDRNPMTDRVLTLAALVQRARDEILALREERDRAYYERNQIVALLARLYPSGIKRTEIEGWDPCWHGCVYIELPTGQASWHYHDSEAHLFADLPPYSGSWDGHTTEEKYQRVAALRRDRS